MSCSNWLYVNPLLLNLNANEQLRLLKSVESGGVREDEEERLH